MDIPKIKASWQSLPLPHRRRALQGAAAYLVILIGMAGFLAMTGGHAVRQWKETTPQASINIGKNETAQLPIVNNSRPIALPAGSAAPRISIIVMNAGLSEQATDRVLGVMPPQIALAFSPYIPAEKLKEFSARAAVERRDILLLAPLEPADYPKSDPGPRAQLTRLSQSENAENLKWLMDRSTGFAGVMNLMGSRLMMDAKNLAPLFSALREKGMFFIENPQDNEVLANDAARLSSLGYRAADIILDETPSEDAIRQRFIELEKQAQLNGSAIGILQPYPVSLNMLEKWAPTLAPRGLRLVAVTELISDER